jgi:phospholipid/cholesterol/gamma-HCH transport system substrate-binding protein
MGNLNRATKPLADRSECISRNLDESTQKLNKTLNDLRELIRVVGQEDGSFRRFVSDPSLYNHLDETVCQVSHMMQRVERLLKDLEVFADKLARHPESLGLGGVVRPSSGLKEAPSSGPRSPGH